MNQANAMTLVARIAFVAALSLAMFAGSAWADAPTRAGRVSALDGSATVQQGDAPPAAAALNWPITSGERLVSAPGSRLELRVGATALQLDGDSTLDIDLLDDQRLELRLEHGRMALHARSRELADGITLVTPQGRLTLRDGGRWRIEAGLAADTTTVAAIEGDAEFTSNDADTRATVPAGRLLRISGVRQLSLQTMALDAIDFDRWVSRARRRRDPCRRLRLQRDDRRGGARPLRLVVRQCAITARSGTRVGSQSTGLRTATEAGFGSRRGAGRGSTRRRGASRHRTTAAGR